MQNFKQYLEENNLNDKQIQKIITQYKEGTIGKCNFPNKFPIYSIQNGKIYSPAQLMIINCMFDDNNELLFPFEEVEQLTIKDIPKTFKNFPNVVKNGIEFQLKGQIQSLDGFPSDISNQLNTSRILNFDLSNLNKYIQRIDGYLIINCFYEGPMLSLLKIKNLKQVSFIDWNSQKSKFETEKKTKLTQACNIINKYLPLGNILACANELRIAKLYDYAKF
jgi:hypothetical protein